MAIVMKESSLLAKKARRGQMIQAIGILCAVIGAIGQAWYLIHQSGGMSGLFLAVFGAGLILYQITFKVYGPYLSGAQGEKRVSRFFTEELSDDWILLNDLEIVSNDKKAQIDHVLIGPYGIILIETKNVKGKIYLTKKTDQWLQEKRFDKKNFYSPIFQAKGHEAALKSIISVFHLNKYIPIRSIILFSADDVELKMPKYQEGIPIRTFSTLMTKDFTGGRDPVLSKNDVEHIGRSLVAFHSRPISLEEEKICPFHGGRFGI